VRSAEIKLKGNEPPVCKNIPNHTRMSSNERVNHPSS
jgi:hypothetical protein